MELVLNRGKPSRQLSTFINATRLDSELIRGNKRTCCRQYYAADSISGDLSSILIAAQNYCESSHLFLSPCLHFNMEALSSFSSSFEP